MSYKSNTLTAIFGSLVFVLIALAVVASYNLSTRQGVGDWVFWGLGAFVFMLFLSPLVLLIVPKEKMVEVSLHDLEDISKRLYISHENIKKLGELAQTLEWISQKNRSLEVGYDTWVAVTSLRPIFLDDIAGLLHQERLSKSKCSKEIWRLLTKKISRMDDHGMASLRNVVLQICDNSSADTDASSLREINHYISNLKVGHVEKFVQTCLVEVEGLSAQIKALAEELSAKQSR